MERMRNAAQETIAAGAAGRCRRKDASARVIITPDRSAEADAPITRR
jgi:hypothetical protein